ncbi:LOW QUALITY PROTEIN: maestro heat-like repeat-containing protein family member 2A [Physeter macrocephalus]|uniref:LOW QUALITY PROTEIN: maestro heat-like repeat-containing protein family member 2A n=1 Tax=Physeter macrocephalus TaxID=9755 RepID=A0A2Y9SPB4_PHYMC|nr:LOW QUALITY PROTEIN: maestro heat-like repeat-containing protein family member 2A [Physeter catodon]|eukprot:XP_023980516.1 LOW QUALITY PROTEIN: maestro heat-like repeat-containing protein family member 2A [Physeter catodon]
MAEAPTESNENVSEETEDLEPLEPDDSGTFQQVTNLLNIMDSESTKTDAAGAGPDTRKMLASVIIREKAATEPSVVMDALIHGPQVLEISTQRTVNIDSILQEIIQQEGELEEHCIQRLVTVASKDMREMLQVEGYVRAEVASDTLVALSRNHFSLVTYELQHCLRPLNLAEEFVIVALAKLAGGNGGARTRKLLRDFKLRSCLMKLPGSPFLLWCGRRGGGRCVTVRCLWLRLGLSRQVEDRQGLGSTGVSTADEPPWGTKSPEKQRRVTSCPPVPKPTEHWRWIRAVWVQRLGKGAREGESQLKVTQPSWSTVHQCLPPPQFLRNSLKKAQGSNWILHLSKELNNQIESFDGPSLEKGFLYRALGFTLSTGLEADKVEVLLLELLYKTDCSNDFSWEGVILCFGLCARGQVKTVLNVLHSFEERIQESEQSWQISAWRKDHPWRRETVKGALVVMYSCVASYCHPQLFLTHVDNPITAKIIHHSSSSCQDLCLKMALMKRVVQIADAVENIKDLEGFQFAPKATLTGVIMAIIKAEPTDRLVSPVRTMAMDALSYLSKLKPFYSTEVNSELVDISIHSVISLQPPGENNESIKTLYVNALRALEQLMEGLVQRQLDPKGLQEMVHLLEKWILSEKEWEREKVINLHLHLMQIYVQSVSVCIPLQLGQFGALVGLIARCTCDSHRRTRLASMEVLSSLVDLHASQTCSSWSASKELELEKCKEELQGSDMEKIFSASSRSAKTLQPQTDGTALCEQLVSRISSSTALGATCFLQTQKKPAVLYSFLLETMAYVKSNLSRIRIAACNLAGIIMKQMSAHYLKKLDFPTLRNSLQELQLDSDPGVRRASLETLKILDTCGHHWLWASP